jgi:hypothetical protein
VWARRLLLRAREAQDGPNTRARNQAARRQRVLESWVTVDYLFLVGGGLSTSIGSLMLFGFMVGGLFDRSITPTTLAGVAMVGAPLLVVGMVLYQRGLRRRTERSDAVARGPG